MATRRPRRKLRQTQVHDRRADRLPDNAQVGVVMVDDPYALELGGQVEVIRSYRDDPLAGMRARGQIEEWQLMAGRRWQQLVDQAQIGGIKALDPSKDAVDGGRLPDPLTDHQAFALRELKAVDERLGPERAALIRDILGRRMTLTQVAAERGYTSGYMASKLAGKLRESLDDMAELFGLARGLRYERERQGRQAAPAYRG